MRSTCLTRRVDISHTPNRVQNIKEFEETGFVKVDVQGIETKTRLAIIVLLILGGKWGQLRQNCSRPTNVSSGF